MFIVDLKSGIVGASRSGDWRDLEAVRGGKTFSVFDSLRLLSYSGLFGKALC